MTPKEFRYSAFISYSHKDNDWVRKILLPTLESKGIKVAIDFRDFEPGVPSIIEMERAVKESWKTILVLSPNYIESDWSEFESLMVSTLDPSGSQRRVIPLLIKKCDIPLRINYLTFLDFTDLKLMELQFTKLAAIFDVEVSHSTGAEIKRNYSKGVSKMLQIDSHTFTRLRKCLMECSELSTTALLRSIFNEPRLVPFRSGLPEATNIAERADLLIDYLIKKKLRSGESLLIVFLEVLKNKIDESDAMASELEEIIAALGGQQYNAVSSSVTSMEMTYIERQQRVIEKYRNNLLLIEEQMGSFIDPRNVSLDLRVARSEIVKKIGELEAEFSSSLLMKTVGDSKVDPEGITNKDLMDRLDMLESQINSKLQSGLVQIYQKIPPSDVELLQHIFEEVHLGRIEQGELQQVVNATGRMLRHISESNIEDPVMGETLTKINASMKKGLTFEQQLELSLPVIPFLLNYKINLGGGVDLQKVWTELISYVKRS